VDLGAEFAHGRNCVHELCADAGVQLLPLYSYDDEAEPDLRTQVWVDGDLVDGNSGAHEAVRACEEMWEELMLADEWRQGGGRDMSFQDLAKARGLDHRAVGVLDGTQAVEYATSLEDLGVMEWRRREEYFSGHDCTVDFSLQGEYTKAMQVLHRRALDAGATVELGSPVARVAGDEGGVLVDGRRFDCAIVTVPLGVLKAGALELEGVSQPFREAVELVRFHGASKVVVAVAKEEWDRHVHRLEPGTAASTPALARMIICTEGFAKQIWLRQAGRSVIATGFLAGPRDAAVAEGMGEDEAANALLSQLRAMCGTESLPAPRVEGCVKVDWGKDKWARGAYSSPSVHGCGAWERLRDTGCARLRYAGEAVHVRGSTVDSALESGASAAKDLVTLLAGSSG